MIKKYILEGEQYKLISSAGVMSYTPYQKNIEQVIALQNQVEYLEQELEEDKTFLRNYKYKEKIVKKEIVACSIGAAFAILGIAMLAYHITGNLEPASITGAASGGVCFSSAVFTYLKLSYRKEISSFDEVVKYVLKTLELKKSELANLLAESEENLDNLNMVNTEEQSIDIDANLKALRDGVSLRYEYAKNKKKFFKYLEKGVLSVVLKIYGYSNDAVAEFMPYIEEEYNKKQEKSMVTKLQKLIKEYI